MNENLLRSSVATLTMLRSELHGSVADSVLETLDEVIKDLEALQQKPNEISAHDVLYIMGAVLDIVPAIVEIVHLVSGSPK